MAEHGLNDPPVLILASGSPRRRELLEQLGLSFSIVSPDVDESTRTGEDPVDYVRRIAMVKAEAVASRTGGDVETVILAADTTVALDGLILAKPVDTEDARTMLTALSGQVHLVHTAVAGWTRSRSEVIVVSTEVEFDELDSARVDWYLATGEPTGKAGAYAIQGLGGTLVRSVRGSVTNVVGLPAVETRDLLRAVGYPV